MKKLWTTVLVIATLLALLWIGGYADDEDQQTFMPLIQVNRPTMTPEGPVVIPAPTIEAP